MSVVSKLEEIANREDDIASKYLANALKNASDENSFGAFAGGGVKMH